MIRIGFLSAAALLLLCHAATAALVEAVGGNCTLYRTGVCQADWMGQLPANIRRKPLKYFTLPGSHDSATHRIDFNATPPMSGSGNEVYQILLDLALDPFTAPIVIEPILELTITQRLKIAEQLEQGIRAFDLRVLVNKTTNTMYFAHSFVAVPMIETVQAVATFLTHHPNEIIVIQVSPDWAHLSATVPLMPEILGNLTAILGKWMVPATDPIYTNFSALPLQTLMDQNKRIFLSCLAEYSQKDFPTVWPGASVNNFWPNGQSVSESEGIINAYLEHFPADNADQLNLIFFTVTPDDDSIVIDVLDHLGNLSNMTSLRDYARGIRPYTIATLQQAVGVEHKPINIVSVDWADDDLVGIIIGLNQ